MTTRLSVLPAPDSVRRHALAINQVAHDTQALTHSEGSLAVAASIDLATGYAFKINAVQVVGPRIAGWVADTGTDNRTANATYAAGAGLAYGAAYVQAEHTATGTRLALIEAALASATQTIKSLKADLTTHGLIGA